MTTPEQRAAKVVSDYFATELSENGADGEKRTIEALIAAAIREAEDDMAKRLSDPFRAMDFHKRLIPKDVLDEMSKALSADYKET